MKKLSIFTVFVMVFALWGCTTSPVDTDNEAFKSYTDGSYRGVFSDGGYQQVSIQFTLTDNVISNVSYRWLVYRDLDYRQLDESHPAYGIKVQHDAIATYFDGKDISSITELHSPGSFIDDVDGWSGATIRGNKIYSAMRDGLNRGAYSPAI